MATGLGLWAARQALRDVLKSIAGGPTYHLNLEGRVYTRHWGPREKDIQLPYACMPSRTINAAVGEDEKDLARTSPIYPVVIYVDEDNSSEAESNAGEYAEKAVEDVFKAVQLNPKLNGTVNNWSVLAWETNAGDDPEMDFGYAMFALQLDLFLGHEFIGP